MTIQPDRSVAFITGEIRFPVVGRGLLSYLRGASLPAAVTEITVSMRARERTLLVM
jgi:hypothetical protein